MAKKSFAVIGVGRFGGSLALTLTKMGYDVLAIDCDEECISNIADHVTHALVADASEERTLRQLGVSNFDCIIIAMADDLRASILTTVLCKELGAKRVIAKAYDDLHAKLLIKTGADKIIMPERETGVRLAHALVSDSVLDYIELSPDYSITEIRVPRHWIHKTILQNNVRARYRVSIIAIRRDNKVDVSIDADFMLKEGDVLVMIGSNENLKRIEEL